MAYRAERAERVKRLIVLSFQLLFIDSRFSAS